MPDLWHYWPDGECPAELRDVQVQVILRDHRGCTRGLYTHIGSGWRWGNTGGGGDIIYYRIFDPDNVPLGPCEGGFVEYVATPDSYDPPSDAAGQLVRVRFRNGEFDSRDAAAEGYNWADNQGGYTIAAYTIVPRTEGVSGPPDAEGWRTWQAAANSSCPPEIRDELVEIWIRNEAEPARDLYLAGALSWSSDGRSSLARYRVCNDESMTARGWLVWTPQPDGASPDISPDREVEVILRSGRVYTRLVCNFDWNATGSIRWYKPLPEPSVWFINEGEMPHFDRGGVRLEVVLQNGQTIRNRRFTSLRWDLSDDPADILAYRILDGTSPLEGAIPYILPPDKSLEITEALYAACCEFATSAPGITVEKTGEREVEVNIAAVTIPWEEKSYTFKNFHATVSPVWRFNQLATIIRVDGDKRHPHVGTSGNFCMGRNLAAMSEAIKEERVGDFMPILVGMLCSYNPKDRYRPIDESTTVKCHDCGRLLLDDIEEEVYNCENCNRVLCEDCGYICEECGDLLCSNCRYTCDDCDRTYCDRHWNGSDGICENCLENYIWCDCCDEYVHQDNARYCESCGQSFCDYHFGHNDPEGERCDNCYEQWLEENPPDEEDEEDEEVESNDEAVQLELWADLVEVITSISTMDETEAEAPPF